MAWELLGKVQCAFSKVMVLLIIVQINRNAMSFVANRVSFLLGLNGPSLTLDTACSSSAYALDVAFKYIQSGACDSAIVAGTQLNLNPQTAIEYSR